MSAKTITIMPDFGMGPYAWLKDASDTTEYVGENVANAIYGFDEFEVSEELQREFAAWIRRFERYCCDADFDWDTFHRDGLALSRWLKQEIGDLANVLYVKPVEDPKHEQNETTEVVL